MERQLATIQVITDIQDIPNSDFLQVATVLGWKVVVKKNEFTVGDIVIYCEIDSVMPEKPEYEWLRDKKFRIRTIKLRGQISQGLIIPIDYHQYPSIVKTKLGDDVTELIGVTKYSSPSELSEVENEERRIKLEKNKIKKFMMRYSWFRRMFLSNTKKSGFPFWVTKTDETRLQSIPQVIKDFKDEVVVVTEKVDYQSVTFTSKFVPKFSGWLGRLIPTKKLIFVVASRNLEVRDKSSLYWQIAKKYNLEAICKQYPGIIIQGEQGNGKIQGNKYGIDTPTLWIFNIINDGFFYNYTQMLNFAIQHDLKCVPYLGIFKMSDIGSTVEEFVEFAKGYSTLAKIPREGVVIRCIKNGHKAVSFKVLNNDFLIKYNE